MPQWCEIETSENAAVVHLSGSWRLANLAEIASLCSELKVPSNPKTILDCSQLKDIDTTGAMLVIELLKQSGLSAQKAEIFQAAPEKQKIMQLCFERYCSGSVKHLPLRPHAVISKLAASLGRRFFRLQESSRSFLGFVGHCTLEVGRTITSPSLLRHKELSVQIQDTGLNAVPIVSLLTFLIGIVIAYLTGVQIEQYGANIFIVDGVSLAMCRELSPILVAIIVAGRSGSAFTAQIGAMKLNEEVDAMSTLGLSPIRVLVLPRLLALVLIMPVLVFIGDIAGIMGGLVIADLRLGVTAATFIERLHAVLWVRSVMVGIIKAPIFGLFVATIGCRMGLMVENNARSVGLNTTKTVVQSIVAVILLNAAFAVLFSELRI